MILFDNRHGLESNVLRFVARLDTDIPIDKDRRFIISYFLSDDSIAVFEPPVRNSGKEIYKLVKYFESFDQKGQNKSNFLPKNHFFDTFWSNFQKSCLH